MGKWERHKLGAITDIFTGGKDVNQSSANGDYVFFSCSKETLLSQEYIYNGKAIIISGNGSYTGFVRYFEGPFDLYQRTYAITPKNKKIDFKFIYYYLKSEFEKTYMGGSRGSSIPYIVRGDLFDFLVPLPPLSEQRGITAVLSSFDDKIDLLRRQNKTLESMAEALFRQHFVKESHEACEAGAIADFIEFSPTRKLAKGTVAPYLEMSSLSNTTFMPDTWYNREFSSGTKFINGDTLLARITPCLENGKTAYITFLDDNQVAWGSTEYIIMRPKEPIHPFFAYILARMKNFRDYAEGCLEGSSGRQRVNVDHLMKYQMAVPDRESIMYFNSAIESFLPKLQSNAQQIRTLTSLRDTLLPKLLSGEVRVNMGANDV